MARQSNVNAAYSPLNRNAKNAQQSSNGWGKLFGSVALAAFLIVFLSSSGGSKSPSTTDDAFISGQAKRPPVAPAPPTTVSSQQDVDAELIDEELVEQVKEEAVQDIKEVETSELGIVETKLDAETKRLGNSIRFGLGSLFGKSLTQEEMEQVAENVEDQLIEDNHSMLRGKAEDIATREIDSITSVALEDEQDGLDYSDIREDVYEHELGATETIREDIDTEAEVLRNSMRKRAAEIEKEILEERLSAKLGKKVKLVIVEDNIQGAEVDGLFQGLDNLVPGAAARPPTYNTPPAAQYGNSSSQYPAYGQTYGQQQALPAYGQQPPPAYGQQQPPPAYGQQPPPAYGQQPPPAYGGQTITTPPSYGQTTSTYDPPPSSQATTAVDPPIPPAPPVRSSGFGSLFGWGSSKETTKPADDVTPVESSSEEEKEEDNNYEQSYGGESYGEVDPEYNASEEEEEAVDTSIYEGESANSEDDEEEVVYSTSNNDDGDW